MFNEEEYKINQAIKEIDYIIYMLPKLMPYESTNCYDEAFETIKSYIKKQQLCQKNIEDDWK